MTGAQTPSPDPEAEAQRLRAELIRVQQEVRASRIQLACERRVVRLLHAMIASQSRRGPSPSAVDPAAGEAGGSAVAGRGWGVERVARQVSRAFSRRRRHLKDAVAEVSASGLFNLAWYTGRYPDVLQAGMDPLEHFLSHGGREGRDPGPHFNSSAYLAAYPDVAQTGLNPLVHYIRHGRREGRRADPASATPPVPVKARMSPVQILAGFSEKEALAILRATDLFDADWYLKRNPDVAQSGTDPHLHYLHHGGREGRDPGPRFAGRAYLLQNPEVAAAGANPLLHHLTARAEDETSSNHLAAEPPCVPGGIARTFAVEARPAFWRPRRPQGRCAFGIGPHTLGGAHEDAPQSVQVRRAIGLAARLSGTPEVDVWQEHQEHARSAWPPVPHAEAERDWPLLRFENAAAPLLVDAWFVTSHQLRVRCAGGGEGAILSCVAFDAAGGPPLLAEAAVGQEGLSFLDVRLANPFLPLVFILTDAAGRLKGATLLPFPSLCRGGLHQGEAAAEPAATGLEAVRAVSHRLLHAWERRGQAPVLDGIEVNLTGATGAERLFGRDLRHWLGSVLGIGMRPADSAAGAATPGAEWLRQMVQLDGARGTACSLLLPADAVPSLQAIFMPRPSGPAPFLLCDGREGKPLWLLAPAVGVPLELQPPGNPFPVIDGGSEGYRTDDVPAALRFTTTMPRHPASLQAPIPPGLPLPEPRSVVASVSVILPYPGDEAMCAAMLAALAQQDGAAAIQVILLAEEDAVLPALTVLQRHFPETGHLVAVEAQQALSTRFNRAVALAQGDLLLILGDQVLLHDARTLGCLSGCMTAPEVASATCLLIGAGERPEDLEVVGLGAHGRSETVRKRNHSGLALQDGLAALPPAAWMLAANALSLVLVRREEWVRHGGFTGEGEGLSTDFFRASAQQGRLHLATTALSAMRAKPGPGAARDPALSGGMAVRRIVA